jgi:hypothetical protein
VGTTGLIFAVIAIAWLAYLVPLSVRRRGDEIDSADPSARFSDSMRVVRYGTAPLLDQDLASIGSVEVSTRRRRRVLVLLMFVLTAVLSTSGFGLTPWWVAAIPGTLLLGFIVLARISVRGLRAHLDQRYETIRRGCDESTVLLKRADVLKRVDASTKKAEPAKVEPARAGRLWDPVPITVPTYVSKPLAPRTVRTIDLSSPEVATQTRLAVPVTADAPARPETEDDQGNGEMPAAATA